MKLNGCRCWQVSSSWVRYTVGGAVVSAVVPRQRSGRAETQSLPAKRGFFDKKGSLIVLITKLRKRERENRKSLWWA